jgi:hypothetical protein
MQGRSIRSLALDYYRKRGAEIRTLDGVETYEIVQPEGGALKVTFTDEAVHGLDSAGAAMPLTATSPQWRAILEDLTAEVAVSYRYLTAGPIPNPAATLEAVMPAGWHVSAAKVLHVDHRVALGVTHRATFDSPALNACQELIFQHLWDVVRQERIPALEPTLYQMPAILLRPEHMPGADTVQALVDRSAGVVDAESEAHGTELEKELATLLAETEKRVNQYYDQQMGNVLAREVALTEKLDATIKKLGEARSTEQMARYRAEGEAIQTQLAHMKSNRERDLQTVETACLSKIQAERERHELTATIDLVALCHATFDVLTYRAQLTSPEGRAVTFDVRYWPLTRELAFPDCPACRQTMEAPVILPDGQAVCAHCTMECGGCGVLHDATSFVADHCTTCAESTCVACEVRCATCMGTACADHAVECATCEAPACAGCAKTCAACDAALCANHAHTNAAGEVAYCAAHQGALIIEAPAASEEAILEAVYEEPEADSTTAPGVAVPTIQPAAGPGPTMVKLFGEGERVVSQLSGKSLDPRVAETCHACDGAFEVQEMLNCATCGVPACLPCTEGELGPCPACGSLEDVERTDARLSVVISHAPALAKSRRQWAIAELGPYVVAHWRRWGHWGMVVYHQGGPEPVVLTEFSHGPAETLAMTLTSWMLPRK